MTTEIIKIDPENLSEAENVLSKAADVIKNGGLVIFPTETVYGLGADATSADAALKIYKAKGRPSDNPLIIHVAKPEDAELYTETSALYYKLASTFMPGPLTVIMPSKDIIPLQTRASLPTVAVRCPENPIARRLIELSGVPIAAPSANLSGSPSPTSFSHVKDDMLGRVDVIIDGGDADFGLESTIVKIESDNTLTLLRPGKITPEQLSLIADVTIASAVVEKLGENEAPLSPGMKYRHYAPKAPLALLDGDVNEICKYLEKYRTDRVAILCYDEYEELIKTKLPEVSVYTFGKKEDREEQAHRLFALLRSADKEDFDHIFAPLPETTGIGLALYNRMIRAAAHTIIKL